MSSLLRRVPGWRRSILVATLLCLVIQGSAWASVAARSSPATTTRSIAIGVHLPDVPRSIHKVDAFAKATGRMPAIVHYFQSWGDSWNRFDVVGNDKIARRGAVPFVSWDPWAGQLEDERYALRTIIDGKHDRYITAWAKAAATWAKPLYIRFAAEMNGDWEPWSRWHNGNTPLQYQRAWRHVVNIFRSVGATNVRWVWAPNELSLGETPLKQLYPGDRYVDWVAFSSYNWGSSWGFPSWTPMISLYSPTYDALRSLAPSKPIMIAETASTSQWSLLSMTPPAPYLTKTLSRTASDKAAWITQGFEELPSSLPQVKALVWFNRKALVGHGRTADWRVEQTKDTLRAFRRAMRSSVYAGKLQ
jgi:hypothetical protein